MRTRAAVLLFLGGMLATAVLGSSATAAKSYRLNCTVSNYSLAPEGATSGEELGKARCSRPFGNGVQWTRFSVNPATGLATGTFKEFFDRGTIRGTFRVQVTATPGSPNVSYRGTARYTGGTAKYRGARGSATVSGASTDGGRSATISLSGAIRY
jgi:hypothetical protein